MFVYKFKFPYPSSQGRRHALKSAMAITASVSQCPGRRFPSLAKTEDWPSSGSTLYTGSTSPTGSGSCCASKYASVSTAWLPDIWPSSAGLSNIDGHRHLRSAARSASQTVNTRRTCVRSVLLDLQLGTLFLTTQQHTLSSVLDF